MNTTSTGSKHPSATVSNFCAVVSGGSEEAFSTVKRLGSAKKIRSSFGRWGAGAGLACGGPGINRGFGLGLRRRRRGSLLHLLGRQLMR